MIDRVVGGKPLPANVRRDIIERTDGVPLFVEEITRAVLEAESAAKHAIAAILSTGRGLRGTTFLRKFGLGCKMGAASLSRVFST
jgi:hypothetical protein